MFTANTAVFTEAGEKTDEAAAIARVKQGDIAGLQALMQRHQTEALRTAFLILGDRQTAEDIVAEAFLTVFHKAGQYDPARPFKPWFYRIVTNGALQWLRRNKFAQSWEDAGELSGGEEALDEQAIRGDRAARVGCGAITPYGWLWQLPLQKHHPYSALRQRLSNRSQLLRQGKDFGWPKFLYPRCARV
jgi:RNA polymerase sigma factor (sigma-70 family)